jgi:hypothetical protein
MNLAGYFSSQAEALLRVSLRDRKEGALAFFGAENKRVKFNQVSEGPPALASPVQMVTKILDSLAKKSVK